MNRNTTSRKVRPWAAYLLRLGTFPVAGAVKGILVEYRRIERRRSTAFAALEPGARWQFVRCWVAFEARVYFAPLAGVVTGIGREWRSVENLRRRIVNAHRDHV